MKVYKMETQDKDTEYILEVIDYLDSKRWYNVDINNPLRRLWIEDVIWEYNNKKYN